MIRDDDARQQIATRVADGEDVAWDDAADDPALRHLQWIERIGAAYRESGRAHDRSPALGDDDARRDAPDFRWGPLDVFEPIGHGTSATVYRAFDRKLARDVALKLFDTGRPAGDGLEEARRLARVRHPNLLTVYGTDTFDGRSGLWTESIVGMDLEDELRLRGCWSPEEAIEAGVTLCGALAALHEADLAHGDLTARNVLRERGGRLVVADLGASTDGRDELRGVGLVRTGTPFAMAPECLEGKPAEARDDVYALGALLFRMLTDHHPVEAETLDHLRLVHREHGPRPIRTHRERIPEALAEVIDRALDREPERRFSTAAEMERALRATRVAAPGASAVPRTAVLGLVAVAVAIALFVGIRLAPDAPVPDTTTPPTLLASRGGVYGAVAPMQDVRVGERLHLDLTLDGPRWVYVLNEDARGDVHVLFPLSALDASNPLAAGAQRLPGSVDGRGFGWQVTTAGGEEHVLVLRADRPLDELENLLAMLPGASPENAADMTFDVDRRLQETLRGIAGLAPSEPHERAGSFLRELVEDHGLGEREGLRADLLRFVSVR